MANPEIIELLSKPFTGLKQGSQDIYYSGIEGVRKGKDFVPSSGDSSIVVLYKRISEQDYNKLIQRGKSEIVSTFKENGNTIYLGRNATIVGKTVEFTEITSQDIKQNPSKWITLTKDQSNETVQYRGYINKTNLKPGTATVAETTGDAKSQATPIVGTEKIARTYIEDPIILAYPSDMKDDQDRIKFSVWKHSTRNITNPNLTKVGDIAESDITNYEQVAGTSVVYLPITKISDSNTVDWFDDSMNSLQRKLAEISLNAMQTDKVPDAINQMGQLLKYATESPAFANMVRMELAGPAVGVGGLLARATGAAFNPNLELLFRSPQLRSFAFSFSMIAKSEKDASKIKQIIKFFKKNMAVRGKASEMFLKSPYAFQIEYLSGTEKHKSLNKIKLCALQSCSVDYTPMGSYMTFEDTDKTMFMYNLGLQFRELTPIYDTDYVDEQGNDIHPIGY